MKKAIKLILILTITSIILFCNFCLADEIEPWPNNQGTNILTQTPGLINYIVIIGLIVLGISIAAIICLKKKPKKETGSINDENIEEETK